MTLVKETQSTTGNITFVNTYDTSNVNSQYISCIYAAESAIGSIWTSSSPIILSLDFVGSDLGFTAGQSNPLAQNTPSILPVINPVTYADLTSKLPSFDFLPSSGDPSPVGTNWSLPTAYARMLGLSSVTPTFDDVITLNTNLKLNWQYGQDVVDTLEHEITEGAMGRIGGLGVQHNWWSTMDLFRYSNGTYDGGVNDTPYFSANGGSSTSSPLTFFSASNLSVNDAADFSQHDVFGTGSTGEMNGFSSTDYQVMDALGWEPILPELEVTAHSLTPPNATVQVGDTVSLSATVKNYGATSTGTFGTHFYISHSATFDSSAIPIGTPVVTTSLAAGATITLNETAKVPSITVGTDYLFAVPDYSNQVAQLTSANVSYSTPIKVVPAMTAIHWKSGISGNFDDGFNWSTGVVPSASDDALIDATGTYAVEITSPLTQTVHSLALVAGATLNITNGEFDLDFFGADTNNGTINVYSHLAVFGALNNTGLIDCIGGPTFSPPYSAVIAYFQPTGTSTNSGTIEAVTGAEISFNITPVNGPSSFTNYGTIEAASGSEITIGGNFGAASSFTNLGMIEALGQSSLVDLFSASGTITNSGYLVADGGTIQISNPNSISGSGTAEIRNGGTLFIGTSFAENTTFDPGANGTLKLGLGAAFTGTLSGFTTGDRIDLSDLPYSGSALTFDSLNNGLTVSNGTYSTTIHLSGSYVASGFKLSADASGSAQVTYIAPVESVNSYIFDNTVFDQTSDAALLVPWFYFFSIGATFLTAGDYSSASASYPGPDSPQTLALIASTTFNFSSPAFTSFSTLQDAYPFGTYTVTGAGSQISSTSSVSYQANYFTSTAPFVTNYSSLNGLNPANDFSVHYNSFTPDPHVTTGFTFLTIWNANTHQVVFQDGFQSPSSTSDLIPANTLSPNTNYTFELDFSDRLIAGSSTQGFDMRTDGSFTTGPIFQIDQPPVIDVAHSTLNATISKASATGVDSASGVIAFQDADLTDRPTASPSVSKNVVAKDVNGTDQTLSPALTTALKDAFTIVGEGDNTNNGKIDWTFSLPNDVLGKLPAGYSVKLTSTVLIDDHNGGTVPANVVVNLLSDPFIPYIDLTPNHPTPTDVVAAALQYQHSLWDSDNCTGLVWAVSDAVGQPFGHPSAPNFTFDSQHVPDPPNGYILPLPPNAPDKFGEWLTVETSDWKSMVQKGDLVRIPATNIRGDPLAEGHSFIVVGKDAQGNWLVIDNTDPTNHIPGDTGPIIVTEHAFNPSGTFGGEVLNADIAYVSRLESGPSSYTGTIVTGTPGQPLTFGNASAFLDGSHLDNETITARNGDDVLTAGSYNAITLGDGNDVIEAGDKNTFSLGNGNDQILAGTGSSVRIGNGSDTITVGSNSAIVAGNGNDTISAGEHSNITVGNGNDFVAAGAGSTITLGNGNDTVKAIGSLIQAGKGYDNFVFVENFGQATLTHFDVQKDTIQLDRTDFPNIASVLADMSQHGTDTVIADGHGNAITLVGVTMAQLSAHQADFHWI